MTKIEKAEAKVRRALKWLMVTREFTKVTNPGTLNRKVANRVRAYRWHLYKKARRELAAAQREVRAQQALREKAYQNAVTLVGVMEEGGNNRGREVEKIITGVGGRVGDSWCGWFCATCYKAAGSKAVTWQWGAVRLYLPLPGLRRIDQPERGDLVRFVFDHIGIFVADHGTEIETIEGNTGATGAVSDSTTGGDGVYRKRRSKSLVRDYVRVEK